MKHNYLVFVSVDWKIQTLSEEALSVFGFFSIILQGQRLPTEADLQ